MSRISGSSVMRGTEPSGCRADSAMARRLRPCRFCTNSPTTSRGSRQTSRPCCGMNLASGRRYNERVSGGDAMKPANPGVKLTYDDFLLFPDDGQRHELIDG